MESDPLLAVVRRYLQILYHSQLYMVCWEDQATCPDKLDGRPQYLELAAL